MRRLRARIFSQLRYRVDASNARALIVGDNATMQATFNTKVNLFRRAEVSVADLADQLAIAVQRQWSREATWRNLYDPYAMRVHWEPAEPELVVNWQLLTRLATQGPRTLHQSSGCWVDSPDALAGGGDHLVDVLDLIPTGRLVVLGQPGSGKTILLVRLVLDLLARRLPGQPVPMLIPLASWNPEKEDLYGWIERWLLTNNPALAGRWHGSRRVTRARALLDSGLILLILDGLDEMPVAFTSMAISKINSVLQPGQRIVCAARTETFREAIRQPSGLEVKLVGTAGVVLRPLGVAVVSEYLQDSAGGSAPAARWKNVLATLAHDPEAPISQCLTTPLMTSLARAIYSPRPGDDEASILRHPDELLDVSALPSAEVIAEHLFRDFVPASYRPHLTGSHKKEWTPEQARTWLGFVAHDLEYRQHKTTDLAWWQLCSAAPRLLAGGFVGISAGLAGAWTLPWSGWGIGIICTIVVGLILRRRLHSAQAGLARGLAGGIVGGECAALVALAIFGPGTGNGRLDAFITGGIAVAIAIAPMTSFYVGVIAAFFGNFMVACYDNLPMFAGLRLGLGSPAAYCVNGFALGLAAGLSAGYFNRRLPARGLRWSKVGFLSGILVGLLFAIVLWATAGAKIGIICGGIGIVISSILGGLYELATPTDLTKATSPSAVLAADRKTFAITIVLVGFLCVGEALNTALGTPVPANSPYHGITYGIEGGITDLIAIGFGVAFFQAMWGGFFLARLWLACRGKLPFRIMRFLHDAHVNRGILRQVGAFYQFRHVELQRHLAGEMRRGGSSASRSKVIGYDA